MPARRIAYLFGAGASVAEASFFWGVDKPLRLADVSEMVIEKAKENRKFDYLLDEMSTDDIKDIERYISLLESMRIKKYTDVANELRYLYYKSVQEGLEQDGELAEPRLTMALLQMHGVDAIKEKEELKGMITLNYDNLLDRASNTVLHGVNYGINCKCVSGGYNIDANCPLLIKLHGSFNWRSGAPVTLIDEGQARLDEQGEMIWIPPGVEKERGPYPFNILWGKAYEVLDCDILRIVGCSLSQNDWGLLSLLFRTQLRAKHEDIYQIQIINKHENGQKIRRENGFLRNIRALGQLDNCYDFSEHVPTNAYEKWLKRTITSYIESGIPLDEMGLEYVDRILQGGE